MSPDNISLKEYALSFVSQYRLYLISLVFIAIFAGVFEISVDYKIKEIIDTIAEDRKAGLGYLLGMFVLYKLMYHVSYFIVLLMDIKYKPMLIEQTVLDLYNKIVRHSINWFDSHMSGEISNKISDFQSSVTTLVEYIFWTFGIVASIIVSLGFVGSINKLALITMAIFIVVYTTIIYWLLKKQMSLRRAFTNAKQEAIGVINDSISNIFGIKVIGNLLTEFQLKLMPAVSAWKGLDKKARKFESYCIYNIDTLLVLLMSTGQIYLLTHLYRTEEITAGGFAFIAMMTLKTNSQLSMLVYSMVFNINPSIAQLRASYAFVNTPIDVEDKPDAIALSKVRGHISFIDVDFTYEKHGKLVLSKFNLDVAQGERIGVVGTSGAGKTTLIKCLLRYFDVSSGAVLIDGHDIRDVTQSSLRDSISMIPQDITMFHRSIRENLKLAKYSSSTTEIIAACRKAKIHHEIIKMPEGYNTIVGERGVKLSGGQRQRVAIARAILKNAPILILDEATSNLDTPTEQLIQRSINEVLETSKATVIAIAHRLSTIKHMDRIIVLDKGKIVGSGTHSELIRKKRGLYRKLWDLQAI